MHREDRNTSEILDEKPEENKTTWHNAYDMIIFKWILRRIFGEKIVAQNRVQLSVWTLYFTSWFCKSLQILSWPSYYEILKKSSAFFDIKSEAFVCTSFDPLDSLIHVLHKCRPSLWQEVSNADKQKQNKQKKKRKTGNSKVKGNASGFLSFFVAFFLSFLSASSLTCHPFRKEPQILLNSLLFSSKVFGHRGLV